MVIQLGVAEVAPERAAVRAALDVPAQESARPRIEAVVDAALEALTRGARPTALVAEVAAEDFARVYAEAEGNAPASVVADIFPRAEALALFVVTLGPEVGEAIARSLSSRDFAFAAALDAAASEAAERAADLVERRVEAGLRERGRLSPGGAALRYSPGYCGWHVSGQHALLRRLHPERIGVRVTEAGFMHPEKSVSGVILAGPRRIHRFSPTYAFCAACAVRTCRARMRALLERGGTLPKGNPA